MASQKKPGLSHKTPGRPHKTVYDIVYNIIYDLAYDIVHLTDDLYLSVLQAVGRLGI
jgi:hypothetical protein